MALFKKSKGLVGLDIGSSAIKAVELKPVKGGGYQVVNLGIEPLAPEAIVDGTILDAAVVIDTISKLFRDANIKTKDVATSVSGNAVIIKKITLPLMTEDELAESIQWEAEQYIPFDIEDVNIDYQILGQGAENMDVLLVAVKKDKINDYTLGHLPGQPEPGPGRRRRVRDAERLRGELRPPDRRGRGAGEHRREHHEHQRPEERELGLLARHLLGRQQVHRGDPEGAPPLAGAGRGAQARRVGRGRAGRERAPHPGAGDAGDRDRDPEDVRLLHRHQQHRAHPPHRARRRHLAPRLARERARRPLRRQGRDAQPVRAGPARRQGRRRRHGGGQPRASSWSRSASARAASATPRSTCCARRRRPAPRRRPGRPPRASSPSTWRSRVILLAALGYIGLRVLPAQHRADPAHERAGAPRGREGAAPGHLQEARRAAEEEGATSTGRSASSRTSSPSSRVRCGCSTRSRGTCPTTSGSARSPRRTRQIGHRRLRAQRQQGGRLRRQPEARRGRFSIIDGPRYDTQRGPGRPST